MKRYLILSLLVIAAITRPAKAQDPHFSQIQYNPLYLNPAFAGVTEYGKANRLAGIYRDQWRTLPVPYSTTNASFDRLLKKFPKGWLIGGGVSFLYDRAGDGHLSIFNPNLTMNFGKYFNKEKQLLTLGITAGVTIKSLDYLGLQFDNQYNGSSFDPNLPTGEAFSNNNISYPNFTLGLNFRTKIKEKSTLDIGASTSNLHQPNQNFLYYTSSKLPSRHTAYAKAKVGIKDNWNIQPGLFFENQKKANQVLINAIAEVRFSEKKNFGLGFGAGYRAIGNDAAIAYLSFLYKTLRVGAAYDFNVSSFRKATKAQGAFELALNYEFGSVKKEKPCPKCPTYVPSSIETIVRVKYQDSANNLVDTIITNFIPADTVPHQYTDSIELILKPVVMKTVNNIDQTITKTTEKIMSMLPIELYFDNDIPKERKDGDIADYTSLYTTYKTRIKEFTSKSKDGSSSVSQFFADIDKSYSRVDDITKELSNLVDSGYVVTLEFRGYASPLASAEYNQKLSERRITSIIKFFGNRLGEKFKILAGSALAVPFGKTMAPKDISDNRQDLAHSVYSVGASRQRKVEVVGIKIEKK
jgi:type IX secretion system PorP/SprF family membrane protein